GADLSFDGLVRHRLDPRSWLDEVTGWAPDHAEVFELLLAEAPWRQRERRMYDRTVLEPRMVAGWSGPTVAELPPRLEEMREAATSWAWAAPASTSGSTPSRKRPAPAPACPSPCATPARAGGCDRPVRGRWGERPSAILGILMTGLYVLMRANHGRSRRGRSE